MESLEEQIKLLEMSMESLEEQIKLLEEQLALKKQQLAVEDERAKRFLALRMQGLRTAEIAELEGVSLSSVSIAISEYEKRYSLQPSHNATRAAKADERAKEMRSLKLQGTPLQEIAQMYGISVSAVSNTITSHEKRQGLANPARKLKEKTGVPISPAVYRESADERAQKFRDLRLQGVTLEDIGDMYRVTRERVRQVISKYECKHGLPNSKDMGRDLTRKAKLTDIEEYKETERLEKQKQYKRFVPSFQIDAHLVGRFLEELGNKAVLYGYDGKSKINPKTRKDGTPYPSSSTPTNIFTSGGTRGNRRHVTVHSWVLRQCGISVEKGYHCHHIDGDVTNNMLENLEVISSEEHGRLTIQEQRAKGGLIGFKRGHSTVGKARKVTVAQVEEIRRAYIPRITLASDLAKIYGIKEGTIYNVIYGWGAYRNVSPETIRVRKERPLTDVQLTLDFDSPNS